MEQSSIAGEKAAPGGDAGSGLIPLPMFELNEADPCCGPPPPPPASDRERPGYRLWHFVEDFQETPAGWCPRVATLLQGRDLFGTVLTRSTRVRNNYMIPPGLYCAGKPGPDSPVLVTANYKLSFDSLRKEIIGLDVWILVLDTRGINVWCAAGKSLFGTRELVDRVRRTRLELVVKHRRLILPQLSATGVSARQVKKGCGFDVVWGPVRAADLKKFIENGFRADEDMRRVTFTLAERMVLIPIELSMLVKTALVIALVVFGLSGIGPDVFSFSKAWYRGWWGVIALASGVAAGTVLVPLFLPWIPGRALSLKGAILGLLAGLVLTVSSAGLFSYMELSALILFVMSVVSFLAMDFTGATPYTSPSGVEKEMRRAVPLQAAVLVVAAALWIAAAFIF